VNIGIVSEREAAVQILERALALVGHYQIAWVARTADVAIEHCATRKPDLALIDLAHPATHEGVDSVRRIMTSAPCPILMLTDSVRIDAARVFEAMGHGALDAADIPAIGDASDAAPLLAKIAVMARLVRHTPPAAARIAGPAAGERRLLVAIGASAGGPAALTNLLSRLPKDFPAAVVIVQHVDALFAAAMSDWLGQHSPLPVHLARDGERPVAGTVLLAGSSDHLVMNAAERLTYTAEPRQHAYRPSIDVFMLSACRMWRGDMIGVLLTGMGRDGAEGLKALRTSGYHTFAQDEASCAVYGMPKAAAAIGAAVEILSPERIAARLTDLVRARCATATRTGSSSSS
jgi:two-component system response regulator WspF